MLDPVNSIQYSNRSDPLSNADSLRVKNKKAEAQTDDRKQSIAEKRSELDSLSISLDLKSDPRVLSQGISIVFQEIKEQLVKRYDFGQSEVELNEKLQEYLPAKNATLKDLVKFFSPENTANRIVSFATGFYSNYIKNHADAPDQENVDGFTNLIAGAIKQGFKEAEEILGDFDQLGEVGENIKKTYGHVLDGLKEFRLKHLNDLGLEPIPPNQEFFEEYVLVDQGELLK